MVIELSYAEMLYCGDVLKAILHETNEGQSYVGTDSGVFSWFSTAT